MNQRELMAGRFVANVIVGNGDRRKMSATLRDKFTPDERDQLSKIAFEALKRMDEE
jgi:hypothetical protein